MLFNSEIFLFLFLPIVLVLYLITPRPRRNSLLLIVSLIFYAWGGIKMIVLILASILLNYIIGIGIENFKGKKRARQVLAFGIISNIGLLCVFKYLNFFTENLNKLLTTFNVREVSLPSIALPIGISFFTFHGLSYIIDVYRNKVIAQRNIIDHGLYITLFPQLIAGPIVRYHDISEQIASRKITLQLFASGIERFIIGLAKKILLANSFADRKSTRLNSSHIQKSRMPSSA